MHFFLIIILLAAVIYGPIYCSGFILRKYNKIEYFSGNGMEFARILLDQINLSHIRVEQTELGDHYDPVEKVVRLTKNNCEKKSLTAVVVAAHEVGHAIQDHFGYQPLYIRTKWIMAAGKAERTGAALMMAIPLITVLIRIPAAGFLMFLAGLLSLGTPILIHLLTLPVELDASFKRALPILASGKYIPKEDMQAARKILTVCALTYVSSALASLFNLWRWIRILRR